MVLHRFNLVIGMALMFCAYAARPAAAQKSIEPNRDAAPASTSAGINSWIGKLDDDRYQVREEATQRLYEAGAAALDPLLVVADGERPEPSDRSVWIMRRLSTAKDPALRRKALVHLASLKKRPQVAAAARQQLAEIEHQEAVDAMEELGARYLSAGEFVPQLGSNYSSRLILDERWHGKDADLDQLRHLIGLRHVIIIGTDISFEGVKELQHCETLQELWLYGTKLTPDDLAKLRKLLPEVMIDYRQGALLGVASASADAMGPAVVTRVEPGSAAANAGVLQGDIIQKFDGEAIPNFKTLTQKVGSHHPGDEITLGIMRNGKPMDLKVKLGKWKTIEVD
jgi:hypothetical protein